MAAGFPRNPSCPSGRPDHPLVRAGVLQTGAQERAQPCANGGAGDDRLDVTYTGRQNPRHAEGDAQENA
eukprot:5440207-Pyramimonas_sp.AAC.1